MVTDKMVEEGFAALMRSSAERAGASDGNTYVVRSPTIADFRAALEAAEAAAWETIDTAPNNTFVLTAIIGSDLDMGIDMTDEVEPFEPSFIDGEWRDPTHWRRLPAGPKGE